MPLFRWLDHAADVVVEVHAPTLPALFATAARALVQQLAGPVRLCDRAAPPVLLQRAAADLPALLVGWLSDVLFLAMTQSAFLAVRPADIAVHADAATGSARLCARCGVQRLPAGSPFAAEVKAVTYHGLAVTRLPPGGFAARVLFDV